MLKPMKNRIKAMKGSCSKNRGMIHHFKKTPLQKLLSRKRSFERFLIHLVGDNISPVPLHRETEKDRGGNDDKIKWFYPIANLHRQSGQWN